LAGTHLKYIFLIFIIYFYISEVISCSALNSPHILKILVELFFILSDAVIFSSSLTQTTIISFFVMFFAVKIAGKQLILLFTSSNSKIRFASIRTIFMFFTKTPALTSLARTILTLKERNNILTPSNSGRDFSIRNSIFLSGLSSNARRIAPWIIKLKLSVSILIHVPLFSFPEQLSSDFLAPLYL